MEQLGEERNAAAQSAEAVKDTGATAGVNAFGKFKDAESLLKAYGKLEAEFTRRSQRLKLLEGEREADGGQKTVAGGSAEREDYGVDDFLRERADSVKYAEEFKAKAKDSKGRDGIIGEYLGFLEEKLAAAENKPDVSAFPSDEFKSEEKRREVVREYLREVLDSKPKVNFGGGLAVVTPPSRPKTLEEAGKLAKQYLKSKGEF